jgi:hypothetical protein
VPRKLGSAGRGGGAGEHLSTTPCRPDNKGALKRRPAHHGAGAFNRRGAAAGISLDPPAERGMMRGAVFNGQQPHWSAERRATRPIAVLVGSSKPTTQLFGGDVHEE